VLEGLKSGNVAETCRKYEIASNLYYRWKDEVEAILAEGKTLTYKELRERASRIAAWRSQEIAPRASSPNAIITRARTIRAGRMGSPVQSGGRTGPVAGGHRSAICTAVNVTDGNQSAPVCRCPSPAAR
jgi:acyl-coenzyme A synthetase/AMP-(fatty) acid ligase